MVTGWISWFLFLFHFLCKMIVLLQIFSILRIWVRDFICRLNILFWSIALFVGGCLCNFLCVGKQGNKEKKMELVFCREEDQENNFWAPLLFPSPSSFYAILFFNNNFKHEQFQYSSYSWKSSNDKHVKVSVVASRKFSYSLLIFLKQFHC